MIYHQLPLHMIDSARREGCNNVDFAKDTGQGDKAITVHFLHTNMVH